MPYSLPTGQHPPNRMHPVQQDVPGVARQPGLVMRRVVQPHVHTGVLRSANGGIGLATRGSRPAASSTLSTLRKRVADGRIPSDNTLSQKVIDLVPESQAYIDLLMYEKKLDSIITRKIFNIEETLKRPMKQNRTLCISVSNVFYPAKKPGENEESRVAFWELKVGGCLSKDSKTETNKIKRKFSSFFKSLVIELDEDLYGPDNHLVEWQRSDATLETDGFQVKRPGDKNVACTILLLLDNRPLKFKMDPRLTQLLGFSHRNHTQTRQVIVNALWQFIKTHELQDSSEKEYINCDRYLSHIFNCTRMKFSEVPRRLSALLHPADPVVINYVIRAEGVEEKLMTCYDIVVEIEDPLVEHTKKNLPTTADQQKIECLDNTIHETVEQINELTTNRDFYKNFSINPQQFIYKWILSQTKDLKTMVNVVGNPEEERRAEFYHQPCFDEAVGRYISSQLQQKRAVLECQLAIKHSTNNFADEDDNYSTINL